MYTLYQYGYLRENQMNGSKCGRLEDAGARINTCIRAKFYARTDLDPAADDSHFNLAAGSRSALFGQEASLNRTPLTYLNIFP